MNDATTLTSRTSRQVRTISALVLLAVSSLSLAQQEPIFEGPQSEIDAIFDVFAAWGKARDAGDVDGVVAVHHPDMQIMTRDRALLNGHAGVRTFYAENYSKNADRKLFNSVSEVRVFGEIGIVIGRFLAVDEANGVQDPGYYLIVLRKNDDGHWRIYRDIDTPSPDGLELSPTAH